MPCPAAPDRNAEIRPVISEEHKRRPGRELLTLKQHGSPRREEEQRGEGASPARTREGREARAGDGVGDLIMVLQIEDEAGRRGAEQRLPAPPVLPLTALALKQRSPLDGGDELLRAAPVISVITSVLPGERYPRAVVEIIAPYCVEPMAARLGGADHVGEPRPLLGHHDGRPAPRGRPHATGDGREDMVLRAVMDAVGRVEPEAVEVELVDPVTSVREEILPHMRGGRA